MCLRAREATGRVNEHAPFAQLTEAVTQQRRLVRGWFGFGFGFEFGFEFGLVRVRVRVQVRAKTRAS